MKHLAAYLVLVLHVGRHHHQAADVYVLHLAPFSRLQQLATGLQGQSILRLLLGDMEFEQDVDDAVVLGRLLVDLAEQLGRIDRSTIEI